MVLKPDIERCASEDAGPLRGWIVSSHIGWRGERNIPHVLKTLRGSLKGKAQGGQYLLAVGCNMVLEPDIERCANEDAGLKGGGL